MTHTTDPPDEHSGTARSWAGLVFGALRFEPAAYASATRWRSGWAAGAAAVLLGGVARGVGAFPEEGWQGIAMGVAVGMGIWLAAALAIWCTGFALNRRTPRFGSLLGALGLAAAPFLLLVLMAFAPLARPVFLLSHGWATLASILAVREAEQVSTSRAALICLGALALGIAALMVIGSAGASFTPPWNRPCVSPF